MVPSRWAARSLFVFTGAWVLAVSSAVWTGAQAPQSAPSNPTAPAPAATTAAPSAAPSSPRQTLVRQYCVSCHSQRLKTGGLVLEGVDIEHPATNPDIWEKV